MLELLGKRVLLDVAEMIRCLRKPQITACANIL